MSNRRRALVVAAAGTVGSRAIWFAAIPIAARLFSPADVGAWPLVTAVPGLIAIFGTLRLDVAITVAHYTPRARVLVFASTGITLCICLITATAIIIFPDIIPLSAPENASRLILFAGPLYILFYNIGIILQAWLLRVKAFSAIAFANASNPIVTVASLILFAFVPGPSPQTFVGAYLLGLVASATALGTAALRNGLWPAAAVPSSRRVWNSIVLFRQYPFYTIPQSFTDIAGERLVQLWIAGAYSVDALGMFYLIRQILMSAMAALTAPVGQLLISDLARVTSAVERNTLVLAFFETAAAGAGLLVGLSFVTAPTAFLLLLGSNFSAAADYSFWLVLGLTMLLVTGWSDRLYYVLRRIDLLFSVSAAFALLMVFIILIAWALHLTLPTFVALYGIAYVIWAILYLSLTMVISDIRLFDATIVALYHVVGILVGAVVGAFTTAVFNELIASLAALLMVSAIGMTLVVRLLRRI